MIRTKHVLNNRVVLLLIAMLSCDICDNIILPPPPLLVRLCMLLNPYLLRNNSNEISISRSHHQ
jgi:hypothetical protein